MKEAACCQRVCCQRLIELQCYSAWEVVLPVLTRNGGKLNGLRHGGLRAATLDEQVDADQRRARRRREDELELVAEFVVLLNERSSSGKTSQRPDLEGS